MTILYGKYTMKFVQKRSFNNKLNKLSQHPADYLVFSHYLSQPKTITTNFLITILTRTIFDYKNHKSQDCPQMESLNTIIRFIN